MKQIIEIPTRLIGMNEYSNACRANAIKAAKMKKETEEVIMWAIKASKAKPMTAPVRVHIIWVEPNMRRDKDNISTGKKFVLDALVKAGILGNDNWKWIEHLSDDWMVNKNNPRVIVELTDNQEERNETVRHSQEYRGCYRARNGG